MYKFHPNDVCGTYLNCKIREDGSPRVRCPSKYHPAVIFSATGTRADDRWARAPEGKVELMFEGCVCVPGSKGSSGPDCWVSCRRRGEEQACNPARPEPRRAPAAAAPPRHITVCVCAQLGNLWSRPWRWYGRGEETKLGSRLYPRRMMLEFGVPRNWILVVCSTSLVCQYACEDAPVLSSKMAWC